MYAHLFTPERRTGWLIFLHGILFYTTRFQLLFSKANDFVGARFSLEHGGETISRITYVHWSKYIWHSQPTLPSEGVYGGFSLTGWVCQPLPSWTREMACSPIPSASLWPGIQKDHASLGNPKEHPGVVFFGSKTINEFWANPKISKVSSPIKMIKDQPVIWSPGNVQIWGGYLFPLGAQPVGPFCPESHLDLMQIPVELSSSRPWFHAIFNCRDDISPIQKGSVNPAAAVGHWNIGEMVCPCQAWSQIVSDVWFWVWFWYETLGILILRSWKSWNIKILS